jgi:uncharacterized protein involved in exopolysaccharide biosynthesis
MDNDKHNIRQAPAVRAGSEDERVNLHDYLRVVFKYRRMIVVICAVAVVGVGIRCLLSPKVYKATTSIVPPVEIINQNSELGSSFGMGQYAKLRRAITVMSIADMYAGILESRAVVDAIIDRFDLMKIYGEEQYRSNARRMLGQSTDVKVSSDGIIHISVTDIDPNRVAAIANAYVEELDQQNKRLSVGQATSKRIFLENRLKEIEGKLSKIDNILTREAEIQEMLYKMLTTEYELAKIEEAKSMPTIQVLDRAAVPEIREPRGTVRKSAIAGFVSLVFVVFLAFARENFASGRDKSGKHGLVFSKSKSQDMDNGDFAELESKRRIVAMQRRKRAQEEERSYSQEA